MSDNGNIKILYVLLDGIGDLPHPDLNGLTPLEAAETHNLDSLVRKGCMGQVVSVGAGIAPQSDIAVFNMLGYDFKGQHYVGRGMIETIGSGMDFSAGDLALRGNFATIDRDNEILDRRAGRDITKLEAEELCRFLEKNIQFSDPNVSVKILSTVSHRVIVRFNHTSRQFSDKITNTDPAYDKLNGIGIVRDNLGQMEVQRSKPEDYSEIANFSSKIVNEFTDQCVCLLRDHPVNLNRMTNNRKPMNVILLRDPGNKIPSLEKIDDKYGIKNACIVDMPVEIGIAKSIGMKEYISSKQDDYVSKAIMAVELLKEFELVYVHIKGPDEFGHDGDALGKKKNIEEIDKNFFGTFLKKIPIRDYVISVSGDHSTPCIKKSHSDDPIPLLISGSYTNNDGSERFTEKYASAGSIGTIMGKDVINTILKKFNK